MQIFNEIMKSIIRDMHGRKERLGHCQTSPCKHKQGQVIESTLPCINFAQLSEALYTSMKLTKVELVIVTLLCKDKLGDQTFLVLPSIGSQNSEFLKGGSGMVDATAECHTKTRCQHE